MPEHSPTTLERLEQQHSFPGPFMFKAIGPNTAEFVAHVTQAVMLGTGGRARPNVSTRDSGGGRYTAVTIRAQLARAQEALDVWALLAQVDGVKLVV